MTETVLEVAALILVVAAAALVGSIFEWQIGMALAMLIVAGFLIRASHTHQANERRKHFTPKAPEGRRQ